jgi:hypothetical protein
MKFKSRFNITKKLTVVSNDDIDQVYKSIKFDKKGTTEITIIINDDSSFENTKKLVEKIAEGKHLVYINLKVIYDEVSDDILDNITYLYSLPIGALIFEIYAVGETVSQEFFMMMRELYVTGVTRNIRAKLAIINESDEFKLNPAYKYLNSVNKNKITKVVSKNCFFQPHFDNEPYSFQYAMFLVIEGKGHIGSNDSDPTMKGERNLEQELKNCIGHWKLSADYLKHIKFYVISPNKKTRPSEETIDWINSQRNCKYVELDIPQKTLPAGWFNVPLVGKWCDENLKEDYILHMDLDMFLLRDIPYDVLRLDNADAKVATYSEEFPDDIDEIDGIKKQFVTCFTIAKRESKFYTKWAAEQTKLLKKWKKKKITKDDKEEWFKYCNLEEHAVDKLYADEKLEIEKLDNIQFGKNNGYGSIVENIKYFDNIYFLHCHSSYPYLREIMEWQRIRRTQKNK